MRALMLRASVRIEPENPFSGEVKVPMAAIVQVPFAVSGRTPRGRNEMEGETLLPERNGGPAAA